MGEPLLLCHEAARPRANVGPSGLTFFSSVISPIVVEDGLAGCQPLIDHNAGSSCAHRLVLQWACCFGTLLLRCRSATAGRYGALLLRCRSATAGRYGALLLRCRSATAGRYGTLLLRCRSAAAGRYGTLLLR